MKFCVLIALIFAFVESTVSEDVITINSPGTTSTVTPTPKHSKTLFKIIIEFLLHRHFEIRIGPDKPLHPHSTTTSTGSDTTTSHRSSFTTEVTRNTTGVVTSTEPAKSSSATETAESPNVTETTQSSNGTEHPTEVTRNTTETPKISTASPTINPTETPTTVSNATETVVTSTETAKSSSATETAESPNVTETTQSSNGTEHPTEKSTNTEIFTTQHVTETTTLYINTTASVPWPSPQYSSGKLSSGDIAGIVIGVIAALCLIVGIGFILIKKRTRRSDDVEPLMP